MIGTAVITLILGVIIYKLVIFLREWRRKILISRKLPTICPLHWFFGHVKEIPDTIVKSDKERRMIKETGAKIFLLWLGPFHSLIAVTHPDTAKLLLKSSEPKPVFLGSSGYNFIKKWLGMGLLLSYGRKWERSRRLLTPAFHFDILKPYVKIYNDVSDLFLQNIASNMDSDKSVEIYNLVSLATLDTMLRCAFSYNDGVQTHSAHPYVQAVKTLATLNRKRVFNPLVHRQWIYNMTANGREFNKQCDYVHKFAEDIIAARRKSLKEDPNQLNKRHLDFLDILVTAKDEDGTGLSDEDIRAEVDTFLFEGHDTTASAISWAAYFLGKYPEEQEKVYDEVVSLTGGEEEFTWENLNNCRQLSLFIKEVLRYASPVPGIARFLTKPFVFDGVEIPKGTAVAILIHHMNHHPDVWKDPEEFRPERFEETGSKGRDPYAYVPFSAGPRNCIGQHFALNEQKVMIARLVLRYRIHLVEGFQYIMEHEVVTRAKNGIKLRMEERKAV